MNSTTYDINFKEDALNVTDSYSYDENNCTNNKPESFLCSSLLASAFFSYLILMLLTGMTGNVITCFVIVRNKTLHTAMNCYLFNLAVADLFILTDLAFYLIGVPQLRAYFKLLNGVGVAVSILTIVGITIERYIAICHPLTNRPVCISRVVKYIIVIWAIGILLVVCYYFILTSPSSVIELNADDKYKLVSIVFATTLLAFPLVVFIISYTLIGVTLCRRNRAFNQAQNLNTNKRAVGMLGVVFTVFILSWIPVHITRFLLAYYAIDYLNFSYIFYYLSPVMNPLLYNMMSNRFRDAFKAVFTQSWSRISYCPKHKRMHNTHSQSTDTEMI